MTQVIKLPSGVALEVDLTAPPSPTERPKLAICLHPWSWLGGQKDDPVLLSLLDHLTDRNYHVLRYNSRGVGRSTGWASVTGFSEAKDLEDLVMWGRQTISNVTSLVFLGYSHGSLIASMHPIIPTIKTSHILISYPLGPRGWLTLFHTSTYSAKLKELIQSVDSNVLIVYGDADEFTGVSKYRDWRQDLENEAGGGRLKIVEIPGGSHFWRGRSGQQLAEAQMPLPDERPRQSVANLIGRFENQVKRQPSSSPGSVRSLSATSDISGDAAKVELKEKREWPPKSITTDGRPPPIVPSSSWTRSQSAAAGSLPSSKPDPAPSSTQADAPDDSALTPRPNSTTSIPDATKGGSVPQRQLSVGVTDPSPSPSNTPTTAKPPAKTPAKAPAVKPASSTTPKTPAKTGARSSINNFTATQPLKPQLTGPASSSSLARKVVPKSTPVTPARAKTPSRTAPSTSRPKTPQSTRSKTPSSGLFAPTAASLARARNAQPPPPTPSKKATLSSAVAERLSKPTAASLSRARSPTSTPARGGAKPPVRGSPAMRGPAKPRVSTASTARTKQEKPAASKAAATGAAAGAVAETEHEGDPVPEENGQHTEPVEAGADDFPDGIHADEVEDAGENEVNMDASQAAEELAEGEDNGAVAEPVDHSPDTTAVERTDDEARSEAELQDSSVDVFSKEVEAASAADERVDEVKSRPQAGDDLEDMVNLLESVSISKARPTSISSIPDEVSEIPDEE
ncbi:hypothetical protein LshimejAT787_0801000 [Lyophyllum shimeji]|uniref:Xaa-Pro dipeptidyl-peptidase-like domain-containing protein n=1 Tax=Lyophyllum shimeji TaxID=47721 RepID=A0A9P3PRJ0_LYOSH|nr:hypothetical protein LshimejAT787_0801000 [Lyophyllum shimeji]